MITFFDLIKNKDFRHFVENRIKSSAGNDYAFPREFPKLYKYRPLSQYCVNDLVNGKLTLSSIGEFNDVFDGAMHQYGSKEEIEKAANEQWSDLDTKLKAAGFESLLKKDDIVAPYRMYYKQESRYKFRELDYLGTFVGCFSEDNASTLMWSHYADSNKGICIEYDFNTLQSESILKYSLFPVAYTASPIDVKDLMGENGRNVYEYPIDAAVLCCSLNKASIWSYEREWRLVWVLASSADHTPRLTIKLPITPSKVYLGYHFLRPFFVYNEKNQSEIENSKAAISRFVNLASYLHRNKIPVAVMLPSIGSFSFVPNDISTDTLIRFINEKFVDSWTKGMRFYYTLHDELLDLIEQDKENSYV